MNKAQLLDRLQSSSAELIADSIERQLAFEQSPEAAEALLQRLRPQEEPTAQEPASARTLSPRPAMTVEEKAALFVLFREHLFGQIEKEIGEFVRETTAELRAEFDAKLDQLRSETAAQNETAWKRLRSIWR